jgi:hypothetical protein
MSLRAERLRVNLARAAGAEVDPARRPGLSVPAAPRDPALVNRPAVIGFAVGIVALFVDAVFVPSVVAIVFCLVGLRRARALESQGKGAFGRRRARWGIGFALFGALGVAYSLWIRPLL